jgi:bacterioferritin
MMNRERSITLLNTAIGDELAAVQQYLYFHFHLGDQGFKHLAELFKRTAIQEMGHVEALAERVLFLKGDVEMAASAPVAKITSAPEILAKALEMEEGGARDYNQAKQLFERLINEEERHFSGFEKHLDNIKKFGPSYLALESFDAEVHAAG